jgi:hypothetical protein
LAAVVLAVFPLADQGQAEQVQEHQAVIQF